MRSLSKQTLLGGATLVIIVAAVALQLRGGPATSRFVIIHSDDAGMCHAVNLATIDSMQRGIVSSTSIMTCCEGFDEFAEFAKAHPEFDYGVHLTLTCESPSLDWGPITPASEVPSLVDRRGLFWRSESDVAAHVKAEEVDRELRAQIDRALEAGVPISHLDNHMWTLLTRPDLIAIYVQLSLDYDLPIRYRKVEKLPLDQRGEFAGNLLVAYAEEGRRLQQHKMPMFDFVESNNYDVSPTEKRNYFLQALRDLPLGVSEILVHCAYDLEGEGKAPHVERRAMDAAFFQSAEAADTIRRYGIKIIDWKEFREMKQRGEFPDEA